MNNIDFINQVFVLRPSSCRRWKQFSLQFPPVPSSHASDSKRLDAHSLQEPFSLFNGILPDLTRKFSQLIREVVFSRNQKDTTIFSLLAT
jgi:hypothetical protein